MTSPAGFLDFFILEASEYIEQLDGLLARAAGASPDPDALQRSARALRGSATMAKLSPFADLAAAVERVARAMRGGSLRWEPALAGAVTAAIDDLKILLRGARNWTAGDDERARTRAAELARFAPERATPATPITANAAATFLAGEASNVAAGIELLVARPDDREGAGNVLSRVRALRGVAGVREIPLMGEAMEAAEDASKSLELGQGRLGSEAIELLRAAAAILRAAANTLREGAAPQLAAEGARFHQALDLYQDAEAARDRIVPIRQLYYNDPGPHLVELTPTPPSSPHQRFRLELVSQVEHLRGLLGDARNAPDASARERMRRELRRTLRVLAELAASFGEVEIEEFVNAYLEATTSVDADVLAALERMSAVLSRPELEGDALTEAMMEALEASGARPATPYSSAPAVPARPQAPPTPAMPTPPRPAPPRPAAQQPAAPERPAPRFATPRGLTPAHGGRVVTPAAGDQLASAIDSSIAGLESLSTRPLTPSAPLPDQPPVPIDQLVYRGRAALERAIEIRDQLRRSGGTPSPEALGELFDLLDLARAG